MSVITALNVLHKNGTLQRTVKFLRSWEAVSIILPRTPPCDSVKMADHSRNSLQTSQLPPGSIDRSQPPPLPSKLPQESAGHLKGWEIIDEQNCLHSSHSLASAKLRTRKEDEVVIFYYLLDLDYLKYADRNPPVEGGAASSGRHSVADDVFFLVSKNELKESKQFDQIINPPKEPLQSLSQGPRLGVM